MTKKFELFMGCLGNGTIVCNKAIEEHGDYKKIAHIAECGKINFYVKPSEIPADDLLKIEHYADIQFENWKKQLNSMPDLKQYEYLLNNVPLKTFLEVINKKDWELWQKINFLKLEFYKNA